MPDKYGYAMQKRTPKGQKNRKRKRSRSKRKKRKLKIFVEKCLCHIKKGKKLQQKQSMEWIPCKQLELLAEREMETIMPYSKKKFKKRDSRPELGTATVIPVGTDYNTCLCPPPPVLETSTFACECRKAEKCPVCKAKETGNFDIKKIIKKPCTCMKEEPKKEFAADSASSSDVAEKKKPLFQMIVNKTNMKIVNKDEVINKMGSSAKAMQKAQKGKQFLSYFNNYGIKKCKYINNVLQESFKN